MTYDGVEQVVVRVRRRGGWTYYDDDAAAVRAAGKPDGWLEVARAIVDREGMNINRRGVVFVSSPDSAGKAWHDRLERLVEDSSVAVYEALLELDD